MFKLNDKVRRIKGSDYPPIIRGGIYTVQKQDGGSLLLTEKKENCFDAHYFEKVETQQEKNIYEIY